MSDQSTQSRVMSAPVRCSTRAALVIRGWPLTVDGLLRNGCHAAPVLEGWLPLRRGLGRGDHGRVGPRRDPFRVRASGPAGATPPWRWTRRRGGFGLLATFGAPHYSVVLPLVHWRGCSAPVEVLGEVKVNPHHVRR